MADFSVPYSRSSGDSFSQPDCPAQFPKMIDDPIDLDTSLSPTLVSTSSIHAMVVQNKDSTRSDALAGGDENRALAHLSFAATVDEKNGTAHRSGSPKPELANAPSSAMISPTCEHRQRRHGDLRMHLHKGNITPLSSVDSKKSLTIFLDGHEASTGRIKPIDCYTTSKKIMPVGEYSDNVYLDNQ